MGGHRLLGSQRALAGQASLLVGEGSCSSLCAPSLGSCHNSCVSLPALLPVFSLAGEAGKTQQDAGLDWALLRPPAACPSMATMGPSMPALTCPPSRCSCTSEPGSLVPCHLETMKLNPEGSSHHRAGQTWPSPPPQASPQGRLEPGELFLGCLCCQLRVRREKWSVL